MNSTRIPRPGVRAALQILSGFVLITCLVPDPALAYIDPGTGSFILQGTKDPEVVRPEFGRRG